MCSTSRDPRRDEYTICTAVAPDAVFTVRTYGETGPLYGPSLVHNSGDRNKKTRRSTNRPIDQGQSVAQVRSGQVRAMQVAVRLHDVPYASFSLGQQRDRQQAAEMVDVLKTADALDRYRLPKLKWWLDPSLLRLRPPANLARFSFDLVCESESRYLASGGGAGSVLSVLAEWGAA